MASKFVKTYTSFSGADLIVSFGPCVIGELQQITWAVQREKAPVYTLGNPDPRSYSRGKRAIAGNCVFAVFDRDALVAEMTKEGYWKNIAPRAMFTAAGNILTQYNEDFENALNLVNWNNAANAAGAGTPLKLGASNTHDKTSKDPEDYVKQTPGSPGAFDGMFAVGSTTPGLTSAKTGFGHLDAVTPGTTKASDLSGVKINRPPGFETITNQNVAYADVLPPLDVTLTFANEYGQAAFQKIYDLEFLNDASGVSVDSIVMERQMTWVGRRLSPIISGVYTRDSGGHIWGSPVVNS